MAKPSWVDLQVNGYAGIDFSSPTLTLGQIAQVTKTLARTGTQQYCPTLITAPVSIYERNLPLLAYAMEDSSLKKHLIGIHLEGPFLCPEDGPRGAHPREHIKLPDIKLFDRLYRLSQGKLKIMTVAPEMKGALPLIRHAVGKKVVISLGHHFADRRAIHQAVEAGATLSTHLGNGISRMLPRHPNPIWTQLAHPKLTAMLITDGHHLPEDFILAVLRAKGTERVIITSDTTRFGGMKPGRYGQVVLERNGLLHIPKTGYLAGSSSNLTQCMGHLSSLGRFSRKDLARMGRVNALKAVG